MKPTNNKRSPLVKRFIIYLILFSASITLITTAIQLYNDYQRDIRGVELQLEQVENVLLRSFTQSLWATNYQELRVQMEGLVKSPNMIFAAVYNDQKLIAEAGRINSENIIKRQYEMHYKFLGKLNKIGVLTVVITLDNIYAELYRNATTILINNALRILFVVIFIYFVFHHLISRHISQIARHFQQLALGKSEPFVLERKASRTADELDLLVSSANEMQERINDSHKALRESEKRYQTLATVAPVGIYYTDKNGYCLYVNETWCEITGIPAVDAEGDGWVNGLHPDDREKVFNEWSKAAKEKIPFRLEYRFQQKDKVNWVLGQALAEKNDAGDIVGYVGTITDITDRKKAENIVKTNIQRLQKLASRLPGMIYQFEIRADGSMHFPYISDAIQDVYHLTAKEVQDDVNKIFEIVHPDDVEKVNKTIEESARTLEPWKVEYRIRDKDGGVRWLYGNSIPEKTSEGGVLWYGFVTDITRNKEMDEILSRTLKMDALGKLTGGIAHDYNNMLGVILGYAEILASMLGEEQHELQNCVNQITHAGERGAKLTKKLLAFSRNTSSDFEIVDINTLLSEEQHMLEKTLTARIKLDLRLENNLWPVYLDISELEDAVLNMSINAMHAIEGNGELSIETSNVKISLAEAEQLDLQPGDYVRLNMIDSGSGIDDSIKEKIFDPFYSTKGELGTGLGLSQVYGFVKRCGGGISVESTPPDGSHFTLYFPRYQGDEGNSDDIEMDKNALLKGSETILVVDDEPALLNLASEILSKKGYQVFRAEHAKRALEILKAEKIDLLLTDIIMPDMDGYELAAIVKEKYPNIKIQLVSGFSGNHPVDQIDEKLEKNLLQKPFSSQDLLAHIQSLLQ